MFKLIVINQDFDLELYFNNSKINPRFYCDDDSNIKIRDGKSLRFSNSSYAKEFISTIKQSKDNNLVCDYATAIV